MGFIGIFWDILNILDVPVSILALKFDIKIFGNFKVFQKIVTKPLFFGKKSLKIFVTVANCNGSEVYDSEVLISNIALCTDILTVHWFSLVRCATAAR